MIVAMSYFTLACMKEDKAPLLDLLQSSRLVMLTQGEGSQPGLLRQENRSSGWSG